MKMHRWKQLYTCAFPDLIPADDRISRQENRRGIHMLAVASLPLNLMIVIAQAVVTGVSASFFRSLWLVGYSLWMVVLDQYIVPEDYPASRGLLYFLFTPMIVLSILLGTLWDPMRQANTFLLYLLALPVFIFDRPERLWAVETIWTLCFLAIDSLAKSPALQWVDGIHVMEFFVAALLITSVSIRIRSASLRNLQEVRYRFEHSSRTGCLNQHALQNRKEEILDTPMIFVLADMDQLKYMNDFYGHEAGNEMLKYTLGILQEAFGADNTYHYGGDEALCLVPQGSIQDTVEKIRQCEEKLKAFVYMNYPVSLSCTFGYVQGTPVTTKQLDNMIRLADIYSHRAKKSATSKIIGSVYDEEALETGILEASISSKARAYEINQLTGLPGMSYFVARAGEMLKSVVDISSRPVIGFFQIIQLREFNNEFGYAQGDSLIAFTGKLLQKCFLHRLVCHITAGQFCIMCYENEIKPGLEQVNEVLRDYKPGMRVYSKAGFSYYREAEDVSSLLDEARTALNSIKQSKNQTVRIYDDQLDEEMKTKQYVVNHLEEALEKGYLKVFYQPIVTAATGKVCNEEALSRWEDPEKGFLMPFQFIPVLEENGLMYKVSLHVVEQVLSDFQLRREAGIPIVPVSINLSRTDFLQCDMVKAIYDRVKGSGFPTSLFKIEITESAFISDQEQLKAAVADFHSKGFEVWLDDFGSEYSTLNLLQELDFDLIKIDMQFMRDFYEGNKNYIIVSHVIEMSRSMGITTLVEGIETQEHYRMMRQLGCDKLQGFLFNRPNSLEYILERAKNGTGLTFEKIPYEWGAAGG